MPAQQHCRCSRALVLQVLYCPTQCRQTARVRSKRHRPSARRSDLQAVTLCEGFTGGSI